ncbi:DUF423 domain-containing protein [Thermomonas brevis]|uniref:DUF423 domain-containing protein n=1 Tax=Thermomonas brevis TaxID=215691 RepID=A0A7G9QVG3_9GAMM|nr:DUF423 domain-containing protein [Thermomonas brevis]QNN47338.1 DUF423 domain-containing protein [Thermomonas brevis]
MNAHGTPAFVVLRRYLAAIGSLLAGLSVALSAYAMHAAEPAAQGRMLQAAVFAFAHGLALTALAPLAQRLAGLLALAMLLAGAFLFCGSLLAAALLGLSPMLAPFGGALMIAGWLLHAYDRLRG